MDKREEKERERRPPQTIKFRSHLHNTVYDVCKSRGWKETDSDLEWDFHWADVQWVRDVFDHVRLEDGQRVNHFRNHYELTRKDLTIKNLKRMKKTLEKEDRLQEASKFDFFPQTYVLPAEYGLFEVDYKRNPQQAWIMKPIGRASGKGIFLFTKISQISEWKKDHKWRQDGQHTETYVVQRYIENPHVVAGKKYDLRLYALVTSYSPLTVWLSRSGFCRFSHHRFSMNLKEIDNTFIHLTNTAIQKTSNKYTTSGCKWGLRRLRQFLISTYGEAPTNALFGEVQQLMLRTLQSVQKIMINDKHCFELYGFDVLVDDRLKPWLIEVNASPSLTAETPADYHMKYNLLDDLLNILDLEKRNTGNEERIGGFDCVWKNGPVGVAKGEKYITSYLGCANDKAIPMSKIKQPPRLAASMSSEKVLI
eukprot:TRINITY_DN42869_c0_g1_i1.p1 TRINITY_DN42869_c0_g1~~TRINITY_DN42869_c0_g1_i1.p1  ORF type:complete len:422 (+),score=170.28 TRINITY_DN42869_c0_g1_i1:105-1370(+)